MTHGTRGASGGPSPRRSGDGRSTWARQLYTVVVAGALAGSIVALVAGAERLAARLLLLFLIVMSGGMAAYGWWGGRVRRVRGGRHQGLYLGDAARPPARYQLWWGLVGLAVTALAARGLWNR